MSDKVVPRHRGCGTMNVHRRLLDSDPSYARRLARIEEQAFRAESGFTNISRGCIEIPVVVHVVYNTAAQNISQAQIDSQIDVLNQDFRKKNGDISNVPSVFMPLAGDAGIQFRLTDRDPAGNPHSGVIRKQTNKSGFGTDDKVKFDNEGGSDAWPADEFLNIWVCEIHGGVLGYAQFPGGPANTDGVVITYTAFGTTGTAAAPFDKGRTATHEIGHWLNLRHIWGDDGNGCSGSDFVADTPNQGGPNYEKPTFPTISCNNGPNGDMFMNYMDYVDDDTMVMFTEGQITRMHTCLDGPRSTIGTPISRVEFPKFPVKELPKELHKDRPKELPKDPPKEPVKELPKDPPKEPVKELPKDPPKEPVKELPKDPPKEPVKELPKDLSGEGPGGNKPPILDPGKIHFKDIGKDPFSDPPKSLFEPPDKGFFEGPHQPQGIPGFHTQPQANPQPLGVAPFVIATGGPANTSVAGPQTSQNDGNLLNNYIQLLQHFVSLHQRGLLDQQGYAAWQQAYATYRQHGGQ